MQQPAWAWAHYIVQVTAAGNADENGIVMQIPAFEKRRADTVIEPFDHENLNVEIPEFGELNPSVENIAKVIYRRLKPKFESEKAKLAAVTVWETEKTWCEYTELRSCFETSRRVDSPAWRRLARTTTTNIEGNMGRRSDAASVRQTQAAAARGFETASSRSPPRRFASCPPSTTESAAAHSPQ